MIPSAVRYFFASNRKAIDIVGGTIADIIADNPDKNVDKVLEGFETFKVEAEKKYGDKAHQVKIQGTKLHKSTEDPDEEMDVLAVAVQAKKGKKDILLLSGHIREDGTIKTHETRTGRQAKKAWLRKK